MSETKPKARHTLEITGVLDIETEGWDRFVLGGLLVGGAYQEFDWRREEEYVDRILKVEGTLWGHNAGKYDSLYLLGHIARRGLEARVFCAGQRIVNLSVGDLKVRDSAALIPMSLEKAALIGGQRKAKTDLPCICKSACGGYCSIKRGMEPKLLRKLSEYLRQDCHCVREMLTSLQAYADAEDIDLTGTIGASAWSTASRIYELPKAEWRARLYRFAAQAKHGGRVQVFRPRASAGHRYDINSSYPAALKRTALPVGTMSMLSGRAATKAFDSGVEGIYQARVTIPNSAFIPPLPVRFKKRVGYPVGAFRGAWTRNELAYAVETGARISAIRYGLVWERSEKVFEPFIDKIMTLRWRVMKVASQDPTFAVNPKKHPLCEWLKILANSSVGKLGQNPETDNIRINPSDIPSCPADAPCAGVYSPLCGSAGCCKHKCIGTCRKWTCMDGLGEHRIWKFQSWRVADCGHVHWSAYGLAEARIELHRELTADSSQGETACYCDTDSCIAIAPRERNRGTELGEWAYEGAFQDFVALAPKVYRYRDPAKQKNVVRAKGIPDAADHWDDLARGAPVEINRGVMSFRSAVRVDPGSLFVRKEGSRRLKPVAETMGDRLIDGTVTVPLTAERIEALA